MKVVTYLNSMNQPCHTAPILIAFVELALVVYPIRRQDLHKSELTGHGYFIGRLVHAFQAMVEVLEDG